MSRRLVVDTPTDLTKLTVHELHDYRLELRHSLRWPGGDGVWSEEDRLAYENTIKEIKEILGPDQD